jgi:hypothetical protein
VSEVTRSVSFPFRDRLWPQRAAVGAALELFPLLIFVIAVPSTFLHRPRPLLDFPFAILPLAVVVALLCRFVVTGYLARLAAAVLSGRDDGLPAWDRMGEDLLSGIKYTLILIALFVPPVGITLAVMFLVMAMSTASAGVLPLIVLGPPLLLTALFCAPASLLAAVASDELSAPFDLPRISRQIGRAAGPYILAFLIAIAAEIVAQLGLLVCCIGVFVTRFLAHCIAVHAFATAYREGMDAPPLAPANAPPEVPQIILPPSL